MYIFIAFGGIVGILGFSLAYYFYVKTKTKEMAIIQNHQPSADKNIYGSSQHNSLELTRLNGTTGSTTTTTTTTTAAPSFTGNGLISASGTPCHTLDRNPPAIRVPQYTLQDVEFVEELGEGAFG
uniref:Uncharacterized protein n=1 Tax=Megaselia scalaris TaxID=36166 RepID=T1GR14_MEGSC